MSWWLGHALDTALPDFVDPYLEPDTGVLRNKVGARTRGELAAAEGDV